jgi:hypothetical protein
MLKEFYNICLDNDFDDIEINGSILNCNIRSFDNRYHLVAIQKNNILELSLSDGMVFHVTPEVLDFLQKHGEKSYPICRTVHSTGEIQNTLDELQSAADDLFGFSRDLSEYRHTGISAESALQCNFSLRDTPQELAQLDPRAAWEMRAKHTLWYPSAGNDFRDLIFCSGEYPEINIAPELFIHTDCMPDFDLDVPNVVYKDRRTAVTLYKEREFERLTVPQTEFAHWESPEAGRIILYRAEIISDRFGKIERPLIYVICENEWFAAEFLIPNRITVETICHVRYGFGGAAASGAWLLNVLKILRTRCFISDPIPEMQNGDYAVLKKYPQFAGIRAGLEPQVEIDGKLWANHGDVTVYEVR